MLTTWVLFSDPADTFGRAETPHAPHQLCHTDFSCRTVLLTSPWKHPLLTLWPSFGHSEPAVHILELALSGCREACKLDPKYITNFGEEVVRGQPVFVLSILLQKLEPMLREAAGVAPWQVGRRHNACHAKSALSTHSSSSRRTLHDCQRCLPLLSEPHQNC